MICGDSIIDGLLAGDASVQPLAPGADAPAVGHLHDLLRGHGYSLLADPRAASYSAYGPTTRSAIEDYRRRHGLDAEDRADSELLRDIVSRTAPRAALCPAYVSLVLDVSFTAILRFVWLTSLFETGGVFAALNLNTDQCGVSFGILQWSQKPGQLHAFLRACHDREPAEWARIMGGESILDYTAKPNGGLDQHGRAVDSAFELTSDPWKSKLEALGANLSMARVQLQMATETYNAELARETGYATGIVSERGYAFLLDLTNQFGAGRVERQYRLAAQPGASEAAILKNLEDVFVSIARPEFRPQVRARREFFRTTRLLSDRPLNS